MALDLVSAHPERVESLILVSPGIRGYVTSGPAEGRAWADLEERLEARTGLRGRAGPPRRSRPFCGCWPRAEPGAQASAPRDATENSQTLTEPPDALQRSPEPPAFGRLGETRVPALFLVGDGDVVGMRIMAEGLSRAIAGSRLLVLKGSDHIANTSAPRRFDAAFEAFLRGRRSVH